MRPTREAGFAFSTAEPLPSPTGGGVFVGTSLPIAPGGCTSPDSLAAGSFGRGVLTPDSPTPGPPFSGPSVLGVLAPGAAGITGISVAGSFSRGPVSPRPASLPRVPVSPRAASLPFVPPPSRLPVPSRGPPSLSPPLLPLASLPASLPPAPSAGDSGSAGRPLPEIPGQLGPLAPGPFSAPFSSGVAIGFAPNSSANRFLPPNHPETANKPTMTRATAAMATVRRRPRPAAGSRR